MDGPSNLTYTHGTFKILNGSSPIDTIVGVLGQTNAIPRSNDHVAKGAYLNLDETTTFLIASSPGCIRDPSWAWWRQALPWWTLFFLVPIYSTSSSLSNLQYWRSGQLPIMVFLSCCSYAANRAFSIIAPGRTDIVSAAGAFVVGVLGNVYSRGIRGTAFTTMVTGVLFLVPVSVRTVSLRLSSFLTTEQSGIAQGGGVTQTYHTSEEQYSSGFSLAVRMITVAAGVTIGLFVSQFTGKSVGTRLGTTLNLYDSIPFWKQQKCCPLLLLSKS
jgi:uncharacterized membrane protein YjjB (DUF3815 family)